FVFLLLGGALALFAPGGIIYFLIPPAIVLLGVAAARRYPPAEEIGAVAAAVFLFLSWSELLGGLEELFSPGPLWIVAPVAAIVIAPLLIEAQRLFARAQRRLLLIGSALIALLGWIVVAVTPAYSQDHQQRFTIEHVTDFASRRSNWSVANDGARLPHSYEKWGPWRRGKLHFSERQRWLAPASPVPGLRPPSVEVLEIIRNGNEQRVRLRLKSNGAERIMLLASNRAHIRSVGVAGFMRPIGDDDSSGKFTITCTGRSCDGAELAIDMYSADPITFTIVGARNGLPPGAAPLVGARPPFARPQYIPDETIAVSYVNL
ncbi:MAG TPA: hypothetical protein VLM36_05515, partial [Sphingomicrobium sp.]|nr:hypothetical protein [Sphingomicrobium sp.]